VSLVLDSSATLAWIYSDERGNMATSYTLGAHFEEFIKSLIESGRYSTASEVMRDGLRLMEEREELHAAKMDALRRAIQTGLGRPTISISTTSSSVAANGWQPRRESCARQFGRRSPGSIATRSRIRSEDANRP
jgi:putative addiction module CopG family antidote